MNILEKQPSKVNKLQVRLEQMEQEIAAEYKALHKETLSDMLEEDINKLSGFDIYWKILNMDFTELEDLHFIAGKQAAIRQIQELLTTI